MSAVVANEQTKEDIKIIVNINESLKRVIGGVDVHFHNAYAVVN